MKIFEKFGWKQVLLVESPDHSVLGGNGANTVTSLVDALNNTGINTTRYQLPPDDNKGKTDMYFTFKDLEAIFAKIITDIKKTGLRSKP